jgi:nucleotide-binding universal stress UspA family protein
MSATYERLLVPVNGSAGDQRALALVADLVHQHPASITLIYVVEVQQAMPLDAELPAELDRGEAILDRAEHFARNHVAHKLSSVATDLLQARSAGAAIVDEAIERRADAIVMSTSNRIRHGATSMGETVMYVLKNAPCDVVIARHAADRPA